MDSKENRIVKLNNENYSIWKYKMELILIKENLWDKVMKVHVVQVAAGQNPDAAAIAAAVAVEEDWKKSDNRGRALIGLAVEDDQLIHIRKEVTAWGTWEALRNYHEKTTLSNKVHIMRTICSLKMPEDGKAEEHINQMRDLFQKLTDIGEEELSESWSVAMLLSSLPRSYDTLITALEAREEKDLTFAFVQQKVLAEYERRCKNMSESGLSESALAVMSKWKGISCFFCNKPNHMWKDCKSYRESLSSNKQEESANKVSEIKAKKVVTTEESDESGSEVNYAFSVRNVELVRNTILEVDRTCTLHDVVLGNSNKLDGKNESENEEVISPDVGINEFYVQNENGSNRIQKEADLDSFVGDDECVSDMLVQYVGNDGEVMPKQYFIWKNGEVDPKLEVYFARDDIVKPKTFDEAKTGNRKEKRQCTIQEEINSVMKNGTGMTTELGINDATAAKTPMDSVMPLNGTMNTKMKLSSIKVHSDLIDGYADVNFNERNDG